MGVVVVVVVVLVVWAFEVKVFCQDYSHFWQWGSESPAGQRPGSQWIYFFLIFWKKNSWIERVAPRACSNVAREQLMRWPPRKITNTSSAENVIVYDDKWSQKLSRDWLHWRQTPLVGWVCGIEKFPNRLIVIITTIVVIIRIVSIMLSKHSFQGRSQSSSFAPLAGKDLTEKRDEHCLDVGMDMDTVDTVDTVDTMDTVEIVMINVLTLMMMTRRGKGG